MLDSVVSTLGLAGFSRNYHVASTVSCAYIISSPGYDYNGQDWSGHMRITSTFFVQSGSGRYSVNCHILSMLYVQKKVQS